MMSSDKLKATDQVVGAGMPSCVEEVKIWKNETSEVVGEAVRYRHAATLSHTDLSPFHTSGFQGS